MLSLLSAHLSYPGTRQIGELSKVIDDILSYDNPSLSDLYIRLTCEEVSTNMSRQFQGMFSWLCDYKSNKTWKEFLNETKKIVIISTDAISNINGTALIDTLLMSLFNYHRQNPDTQLALFIDKIQNQNLCPNGRITQILREGRKYHIALNYATQFIQNNNKDKMTVVNLAETHVYLKPDIESAKDISKVLNVSTNTLCEMEQGECYVSGNFLNKNSLKGVKNGVIHGYTYRNFVK